MQSPEDKVKFSDAYARYRNYCDAEAIKNCFVKKAFRKILNDAGYTIGSSTKDSNQTFIFGVRMMSPE